MHSDVFLFRVPQHDNADAEQTHHSTNWNAEDKEEGGWRVLLQHQDNNVNTRIPNRNTFFSKWERTDGAISSLPPCKRNVG